jgi:hypothetical protein
MYAILESYASEDRRHVDYVAISKSEEFRRYGLVNLIIICLYLVVYLGAFCVCKHFVDLSIQHA